ncbi:hypothetical protein LTR78_005203 [Recurvomyces mirabilis]|uniref:Uncharacterized protein n=1 Tax=Recurvomyces mirabilis TaxID=574656 RepID=A0AAE0WN40_9PEZI|nr:hypothetical protein LTR78_005203 [Recurvomyces mirabilis]KAK5157753.1 hypothetical protein LTS14_003675 [Recurvomyces mirabilis]
MSTQLWTDHARATHPVDAKHEAVINTIQALLNDEIDPSEAGHSIAATYEPYLKYEIMKTSSYYKLGIFWSIFCQATRQFGDTKARELADVVIGLASLPPVRDDAGKLVRHQGGGVYWTDLPEFGAMFRDYGNYIDDEGDDDWDDVGEEWLKQAPAYLNATTFLATLFARSSRDVGGTFNGSAALKDALENDEVPRRQKCVTMYLEPAAVWMSIAGEKLYCHCAGRSGAASAAAGVLWKGGHALSFERWSFWRERFETLSEAAIGERYRAVAVGAVTRMKEIEVSNSG